SDLDLHDGVPLVRLDVRPGGVGAYARVVDQDVQRPPFVTDPGHHPPDVLGGPEVQPGQRRPHPRGGALTGRAPGAVLASRLGDPHVHAPPGQLPRGRRPAAAARPGDQCRPPPPPRPTPVRPAAYPGLTIDGAGPPRRKSAIWRAARRGSSASESGEYQAA